MDVNPDPGLGTSGAYLDKEEGPGVFAELAGPKLVGTGVDVEEEDAFV